MERFILTTKDVNKIKLSQRIVDNTVTKKDQIDKDKLTLLHKRLFNRGRHVILNNYNKG